MAMSAVIQSYWKWIVGALCTACGALLAYWVRKNYTRFRYALLSDQQKHRLKGLNRQALAQMMADQQGRLEQAAESKRKACVQMWSQKLEGGVTLSGILITSWDSWNVEERREFCEGRQLEVMQAANEAMGQTRGPDESEDWVKGCLHDLWTDLGACPERKARSKGGWIELLEVVLKGKTNDPKRVARSKIDSTLKRWAKAQSTKPNVELSSRGASVVAGAVGVIHTLNPVLVGWWNIVHMSHAPNMALRVLDHVHVACIRSKVLCDADDGGCWPCAAG